MGEYYSNGAEFFGYKCINEIQLAYEYRTTAVT